MTTALPVSLASGPSVPSGTAVGSFIDAGGLDPLGQYSTSYVHFQGADANTPLTLTQSGNRFTLVTAAATTFTGSGGVLPTGSTPYTLSIIDSDGGSGTAIGSLVVTPRTSPVVIGSVSANATQFGTAVTHSVTVTGAGTPTGTVTLMIDGVNVQTLALGGGSTTFTPVSTLAVGYHTVVFVYAGDANNLPASNFLIGGQVVNSAAVSPPPPVVTPSQPVVSPAPEVISYGSQVQVRDPVTGQVVRTFTPFLGFFGTVVSATADLNGDGVADLVVGAGAGGAPHVKVFDGVSGAELRSFYAFTSTFAGGVSVATGDVNGDGRAELIVAAGAGAGPHVKVFDGVSGAEIASFFAYDPSFGGGVSVATGDLDGDGRAEIITGAGAGGGTHVKAFSFVTLREVRSFIAYDPSFGGGVSVAAGDLDGDGRAEIITGAGAGGGPHVKAFDGRTGNEVRSFLAFDPTFLGGVTVATRDVNRDGYKDIVVGTGPGGRSHVKAFDGRTLAVLESYFATDSAFLGGVYVA